MRGPVRVPMGCAGWRWSLVLIASTMLTAPGEAAAQSPDDAADPLNLFFDCNAPSCRDDDFFRRQVPIVNWVRDREAADVHVLVTSQGTGGGGLLYSLAFIGLGTFDGQDLTLVASTGGDATDDDRRSNVSERLKVGLVGYLSQTPAADQLSVVIEGAGQGPGMTDVSEGPGAAAPEDDPWDFWVFRINANGFVNGEATSQFANYFGTAQASRTTDEWKFSINGTLSEDIQEFQIPDGDGVRTVRETQSDWNSGGLIVNSLGPKWSVGMRASVGSSTFRNIDYQWEVQPGIEYNIFPYSESDRRSLTLQYLVGPTHFNYTEETIFDQTSETRGQHSLTARLSLVQPWGRWSTSVDASQYLHDTSKYNVRISGNFNIRLFRGFSVRVGGNYSWIRDQLFLSAAGATNEQILLRRRQLGTSYRYFTNFGIEYRFGSIFNNVVNPRFGPERFLLLIPAGVGMLRRGWVSGIRRTEVAPILRNRVRGPGADPNRSGRCAGLRDRTLLRPRASAAGSGIPGR